MFEVKFADIGEGIHEGVIYKFEKNVGDNIEDGETLFLVETDKVTAEIPSPVDGIVKEIHFKEGDTIEVGQTIVSIQTDDDVNQEVDSSDVNQEALSSEVTHEVVKEKESTSVVGDLEVSSEVIPSSYENETVKKEVTKKVLATPVARKLAKDLNVNIQEVEGTGPAGRVMKSDIKAFAAKVNEEVSLPKQEEKVKPVEKQVVTSEGRREKMTMMRKTIAEKMVESKFTIPHTAMMDEVMVDQLVEYRNEVKNLSEDVHLTYLPFIMKAVAVALKEHPILNAALDWDNKEIIYHDAVNIGIAVDTKDGLTVPVMKHVEGKGILEIGKELSDISEKARSKSLNLSQLQGGTFTITNYGALGAGFGVPIIHFPEVAILGIGTIAQKPVVKDGHLDIGYVLPLSMSFDHRIVDGGDAGRFMKTLKTLLENPNLLLLS